ncbi:MAG: signal peptidase I [Minisyncoccia bacterium]
MNKMQNTKSLIKETVAIILVSLAVVIPIRIYIAQPFIVSGGSMDNTFINGQYLIVDEISYRFESPQRGDVVIFKIPPEAVALSSNMLSSKIYFIKRIIGLPGETVSIDGNDVTIINKDNPDGMKLVEKYTLVDNTIHQTISMKKTWTLGNNEYFVMGDNRDNSSDSRYWGPLKADLIKGRPMIRLFPITKISFLPGKVTFK